MAKTVKLIFDVTQNAVKTLNDIEKAGDSFVKGWKKNNEQVLNASKKGFDLAFKLAAAGAAAFGAALAKTAIDGARFQASISEVAAVTRATTAELKALEQAALTAGRNTKFTAKEAADGLILLARSGLDTADSIGVLEDTLNFAAASGGTLEQSASLMSSTMKQFNLSAGEGARIADVFATALAKSRFDVDSLTEAMKFAGTVGSSLGFSLEETTAAVAQFVNLGLEGSMAGTNFRMAMVALTKETDKGKAALQGLGLTYKDVNPEVFTFTEIVEKMGNRFVSVTEAVEIFGTRAGANMANIINKQAALRQAADEVGVSYEDLTATLQGLNKELLNAEGNAAQMARTMLDNVSGQFEILKSVIADVSLGIASTFSGSLQNALENFQTLIKDNRKEIVHFFVEGMEIGKIFFKWLVTALKFAIKGFGNLMFGVNSILNGLGFIVDFFKKNFVLLKGFAAAIVEGPIGFAKFIGKNSQEIMTAISNIDNSWEQSKRTLDANQESLLGQVESMHQFADTLDKDVKDALDGFVINENAANAVVEEAIKQSEAQRKAKEVEAKAEKILSEEKKRQAEIEKQNLKLAKERAEAEYERIVALREAQRETKALMLIEKQRAEIIAGQFGAAGASLGAAASALGGASFATGGDAAASLGAIFTNLGSGLASAFEGTLNKILVGTGGADFFGGLFSFEEMGTFLGDRMTDFLDGVVGPKGSFARDIVDGMGNLMGGFISTVVTFLPEIIAFLERVPDLVLNQIPKLVEALPKVIQQALELLPVLLTESIPALVTVLLTDVIPAIIRALPTIVDALITGIIMVLEILLAELPNILGALFTALFKIILKLPEQIGRIVAAAIKGTLNAVGDVFKNVGDAFSTGLNDLGKSLGIGGGSKGENRRRRQMEAAEIRVAGAEAGMILAEEFLNEYTNQIQSNELKDAITETFQAMGAIGELKEKLNQKDIKEIVEELNAMGESLKANREIINEYILQLREQRNTLRDGAEAIQAMRDEVSGLGPTLEEEFTTALEDAFSADSMKIGAEAFMDLQMKAADAAVALFEDRKDKIEETLKASLDLIDTLEENLTKAVEEQLKTNLESVDTWLEDSKGAVEQWFNTINNFVEKAKQTFNDLQGALDFAADIRGKIFGDEGGGQSAQSLSASIGDALANQELISEETISALADLITAEDFDPNEFLRLAELIEQALKNNEEILKAQLEQQKQAALVAFKTSGLGVAGFDLGSFDETNKQTVEELAALFQSQLEGNDFVGAEATLQKLRDEKLLAFEVEAEARRTAFEEAAKADLDSIAETTQRMRDIAEAEAAQDLANAAAARDIALLAIQANVLMEAQTTNQLLKDLIDLDSQAIAAETVANITENDVRELTTAFGGLGAQIGTGRFIESDQIIKVHKGERVFSRDDLRALETQMSNRTGGALEGGADLSALVSAIRESKGDQRIELVITGEGDVGMFVAKGIRALNRSNNLTQTNGQIDVKVAP